MDWMIVAKKGATMAAIVLVACLIQRYPELAGYKEGIMEVFVLLGTVVGAGLLKSAHNAYKHWKDK